ncbi:MAG: hypothetical protein QE271_03155 [Bacteriovoracaceae bacterium]|nr:hypothetical protein [Bacteriovoracaceae bacterium]
MNKTIFTVILGFLLLNSCQKMGSTPQSDSKSEIENEGQHLNQLTQDPISANQNSDSFTSRVISTIGQDKLICPPNYIKVPGNFSLGTSEFCLMQYEARKSEKGHIPISNSTNSLYRNITFAEAKEACLSLNSHADFSKYHRVGKFSLMTNSQWMAVARNIESNKRDNRIVDSQDTSCYKRGNVGMEVIPDYKSRCGYGAGSSEINRANQLNFHTLTNGEKIMAFSGNLYEFVRWSEASDTAPLCPNAPNEWVPVKDIHRWCNYPQNSFMPNDQKLTHLDGIGEAYLSSTGIVPFRSGFWLSYSVAGIYLLNFCPLATKDNSLGFRCAYDKN